LPPRDKIASFASSREKAGERAGDNDGQARERLGCGVVDVVGHPYPRGGPLVDDRDVPVDSKPVDDCSAITAPTPSASASSSTDAARMASMLPKCAARARAAVGRRA